MSAEAYVVCTSCGRKLAARFEACVYCGGPVAAPNARAAPASLPPPGPWKGRESTPPPAAPGARESTPPTATARASTRPPADDASGLALAEVERRPRRESARPPAGPVGMAPVHRSVPPPPGARGGANRLPGWLLPAGLGLGALLVVLAFVLFVRPGFLRHDRGRTTERIRALLRDCGPAAEAFARCSREGLGARSSALERMSQAMGRGCGMMTSSDSSNLERDVEALDASALDRLDDALDKAEIPVACAARGLDCEALVSCVERGAR